LLFFFLSPFLERGAFPFLRAYRGSRLLFTFSSQEGASFSSSVPWSARLLFFSSALVPEAFRLCPLLKAERTFYKLDAAAPPSGNGHRVPFLSFFQKELGELFPWNRAVRAPFCFLLQGTFLLRTGYRLSFFSSFSASGRIGFFKLYVPSRFLLFVLGSCPRPSFPLFSPIGTASSISFLFVIVIEFFFLTSKERSQSLSVGRSGFSYLRRGSLE